MDRRQALTKAMMSAGAVAFLAPDKWTKPVMETVLLPAHAGTSPVDQLSCPDIDGEDTTLLCHNIEEGGTRSICARDSRVSEHLNEHGDELGFCDGDSWCDIVGVPIEGCK